jgi:glycosyltransferase involved in cell wall biosynthesis
MPVQFYYELWQRAAAKVAIELDRQVDFDVIHHITFASYWGTAGVAKVAKPMVWGPVGGGVVPPPSLRRTMGLRGEMAYRARALIRPVLARVSDPIGKRSAPTLVLAQNSETIARLGSPTASRIVSNATSVTVPSPVGGHRSKDVIFVGRLIPWKGGVLAVRVVKYLEDANARLVVFGHGPDERRMKSVAQQLGVADRVQFEGSLAREALLERVSKAGVLLHTALHEEAGLAVAEALSLGTPVVCLAHGGPAELIRRWPVSPAMAVAPVDAVTTARQLAAAVDAYLGAPPPIPRVPFEPVPTFVEQLLAAYDEVRA